MTYMHKKKLTKHRKLPDGRMVLFDTTSGKFYDPVTDTFLNPDEVVKYGLMEKAPPSSKAEDWIKNNKENFKKQYGKKWEQVLYATAWKKFGNKTLNESVVKNMPEVKNLRKRGFSVYVSKINRNDTLYEIEKDNKEMTVIYHKDDEKFHIYDNSRSRYKHSSLEDAVKREFPQDIKEHKNPEYIDKWKDEGFDIGIMHDDNGTTFVVSKDNVDIEIHEPEIGTYETDGKSFNSFDDAMSYQIKSSFTDINVNENIDDFRLLLNRLNLTEKFSFSITKDDKEVLKKAYDLGSKSNDGTILKGRSPIDDEMFELIISHPDIRKKLIAYFTKGFNGQ